jgi:DNA-binding CsgD family transcriptional regulator
VINKALSPAERRIAVLVPSGKTNKEIAADLGLSYKTVKFHLTMVFKKLEVSNRVQLATRIVRGYVL